MKLPRCKQSVLEITLRSTKSSVITTYIVYRPLLMLKAGLSQELLEAAKILNSGKTDYTEDGKLNRQLSFLTELDTSRWFQAVCNHMLQHYPNTLKVNFIEILLEILRRACYRFAIESPIRFP